MAKDDDRTNKPEEAGKWGTAGKSSGKNNKNGKGKEIGRASCRERV